MNNPTIARDFDAAIPEGARLGHYASSNANGLAAFEQLDYVAFALAVAITLGPLAAAAFGW